MIRRVWNSTRAWNGSGKVVDWREAEDLATAERVRWMRLAVSSGLEE